MWKHRVVLREPDGWLILVMESYQVREDLQSADRGKTFVLANPNSEDTRIYRASIGKNHLYLCQRSSRRSGGDFSRRRPEWFPSSQWQFHREVWTTLQRLLPMLHKGQWTERGKCRKHDWRQVRGEDDDVAKRKKALTFHLSCGRFVSVWKTLVASTRKQINSNSGRPAVHRYYRATLASHRYQI